MKKTTKKKNNIYSYIVLLIIFVFLIYLFMSDIKDDATTLSPTSPEVTQTPSPTQTLQPTASLQPTPTIPPPGEFGILVNRDNPLPNDFVPEVSSVFGTQRMFDSRAVADLEALLNAAKADGYPMYLVSTYRSIEYQIGLYNNKVQDYLDAGYTEDLAKIEAAKWVAIPGTSEHNLGLAADIVYENYFATNDDLTQDFDESEHFTWLYENSYKYGFILRFTEGDEAITGIVYEPWHYRYVGVELATYLTENDLTLEEYYMNN